MRELPQMTVKQLLDALNKLGPTSHKRIVQVWLPGSYVALAGVIDSIGDGKVLIEGNLMPGSALLEQV